MPSPCAASTNRRNPSGPPYADAATLKADTAEKTLAAIGKWIQVNLKYDGNAAYAWRMSCSRSQRSNGGTYGPRASTAQAGSVSPARAWRIW